MAAYCRKCEYFGRDWIMVIFYYTPTQQSCWGVYWFHSVCLSVYNIISRHYKKSLIRSQIYHGYEELSTDTNYPIWRRQERRSKYAVQLASWHIEPMHRNKPNITYLLHGSWDQILQRRLSRILCPLCSTYSSGWIHFIFIHLIKQLQKVCCM